MKELFRERDITRVSYYKAVLEDSGIPTMIRNEYLTGAGLTDIPVPTETSTTEENPLVKLNHVLADFQASDRVGIAAVVTESHTRNWIQFFLISKGRIHLDFPNHIIKPPDFALNGTWERVAWIPDLPYPVSQSHFSDTQIESLKKMLDKKKIGYFVHRQAIFDANREILAAAENFQIDLQLTGEKDSEFILEIFQVVYGHTPATIEVQRTQLTLD